MLPMSQINLEITSMMCSRGYNQEHTEVTGITHSTNSLLDPATLQQLKQQSYQAAKLRAVCDKCVNLL